MATSPTRWGLAARSLGRETPTRRPSPDVRSAIEFHIQTFGADAMEPDPPLLEAFVAEAIVAG
jgi:hypothetical protein